MKNQRSWFVSWTRVQPTPQDIQLMSKYRVLGLKPRLRLEWRGQDGQCETEQPDHSASSGVSITSSTQMGFSVCMGLGPVYPLIADLLTSTRQFGWGQQVASETGLLRAYLVLPFSPQMRLPLPGLFPAPGCVAADPDNQVRHASPLWRTPGSSRFRDWDWLR